MTRASPRESPFVVPLAGLLGSAPGSERRIVLNAPPGPLAEDLVAVGPIVGQARVARTNRGLLVAATVRTAVAATCVRCLAELAVPLETAFEEEVLASLDLATGQPLDRTAEPDVVRLDDHHRLDFEPLVRDAVSLAEPIAPLCRPDCPGLCPECGARLADGHAAHEPDDIDPRLAALRGFAGRDEA